MHEKCLFSDKITLNWICGKCQIARRAWFWHVASQMLKLVQNLPQSITALFMWESEAIAKEYESEVVDKIKELNLRKNIKVVQMNLSEEIAHCLQHSLNLEVCITSEGVFEKPEIAKCLRMIAKEYDKFTSQELRTERAKMQNERQQLL